MELIFWGLLTIEFRFAFYILSSIIYSWATKFCSARRNWFHLIEFLHEPKPTNESHEQNKILI